MRTWILAGLLACNLPFVARGAESNTVWAYQRIFATTGNLTEILPIVKRVRDDKSLRQDGVLDFMAELMLARPAQDADEDYARKEMVESLGRYGGPRYDTVLHKMAGDWAPSKARESAKLFMRGAVSTKVPQYFPGTIDLTSLRARITADALASPVPTDEMARHLEELPLESTIDQVIAWAGKPQAVAGRVMRRVPLARVDSMSFLYRGVGRVLLRDRARSGGDWRVVAVSVEPLAFEDLMPYRDEPAKYGQPDAAALAMMQLLSDDPPTMRLVLEAAARGDSTPLEFMDTAAELMLSQRTMDMDAAAADAYSWICVLLRQNGGPRYAPVLATVAAEAHNEKLRKHAAGNVDPDRNAKLPPYVTGSISLVAQRAKYPSIYPQRTYHARKR